MQTPKHSAISPLRVFQFGLFSADAASGTLTRGGVRVKIHDQPFSVLIALLERPAEIVTREDLRRRLWPDGTYVDFDECLNVILKKLRAAIDDDSNNPRFIETVPRKGYRFIAPVMTVSSESATPIASGGPADRFLPGSTGHGETTISARWFRLGTAKIAWAAAICVSMASVAAAMIHYRPLWRHTRINGSEVTAAASVAVVPFANWGAGPSFDYLRFALASDIVTDLTYARSISVRPFISTAKYGARPADPETVC